MDLSLDKPYWRYWGKAKPQGNGAAWHLLPFHSLDVAAVMSVLLDENEAWLAMHAERFGWTLASLKQHLIFFAAIHDVGKFARTFQGVFKSGSPDLVSVDQARPYVVRHDSLGLLAWFDCLRDNLGPDFLPDRMNRVWGEWIRAACGHHGRPPEEGSAYRPNARDHYRDEDLDATFSFVQDVMNVLLPDGRLCAPPSIAKPASRAFSWPFAGLITLADWLGSNQSHFPYASDPVPLEDYWLLLALPRARLAVSAAGLRQCAPAGYVGSDRLSDLIPYLSSLTPLQHHAANAPLPQGPGLFLLEDVTGAGKTEAALILAHRLMAAGGGRGLYFALPTMATSNQMYRRVGAVYQRFFAGTYRPSIILAHSARHLVEDFMQAVQDRDHSYAPEELSASQHCNAWLADSGKKALLSHVGVGSIDQALLSILPARHQSLRVFGLKDKVLIVDEVHGYDPYVKRLLCQLLRNQAMQGGSVILLSATVPHAIKDELVNAYCGGLGLPSEPLPMNLAYPLVTQVCKDRIHTVSCDTRDEVKRRVCVQHLHDLEAVLALVSSRVAAGECVCWIRNTVDDARQAFDALCRIVQADRLHLFHSRYAMGHRLDIENTVLDLFGKTSSAVERRGRVIVGSQVLEQALDFDADVMISDLAPIDLIIQRAGRLQRHVRDADGTPLPGGREQRAAPVLYVYGPEPDMSPDATWYARLFAKGQFVYPDTACLWRTQQMLLQSGCIVSPGDEQEPGAVRQLVESVYGDMVCDAPESLKAAADKCMGEARAQAGMANYNGLDLDKGYCEDSSQYWDEEVNVPTRLGDETRTVYLARVSAEGKLEPLYQDAEPGLRWPLSAVRMSAVRVVAIHPDWAGRFAGALDVLQQELRWIGESDVLLPLLDGEDGAAGECIDKQGRKTTLYYSSSLGVWLK